MELNRDLIKWCRDLAKSDYKKAAECYICGNREQLDFHHYSSMTELLNVWLDNKNYTPTTDDEIKMIREQFIADHNAQIYKETVTLCHTHHLRLHSIYGKSPKLSTASKQARWVEIQRCKRLESGQSE